MHKGLNESEKQSIEIQDSSSLPPAFNSRPLIVIIKNNTDDKHYNVPVINPKSNAIRFITSLNRFKILLFKF